MKPFLTVYLLFALISGLTAWDMKPGIRIDLGQSLQLKKEKKQLAQIFIPDYFEKKRCPLIFHFHGSARMAEDALYKTGQQAIIFSIHLGLFSSPYRLYFSNKRRFQNILQRIKLSLISEFKADTLNFDAVILTSFSAGYAGIREIIKNEENFQLIDGIILADGLHADSSSTIYPRQMSDYVRFAQKACNNRKAFYMTHSSIPTPGYMSTTESTDYLLKKLGIDKTCVSKQTAIGLQTAVCDNGNFYLESYTGETAADHMQHFYHLNRLLSKMLKMFLIK